MTGTGEMIERVAMALASDIEEGFPRFTHQRWDQLTELSRQAMRQRARVAIEALREPTFDMVEAGQETNNLLENPDPPNAFKFLSRDEMTEAWKAMIGAALE